MAAAAILSTAAPALAKSYRIVRADEIFRIRPDGSILATERLTFRFDGSFHGAYRLIPVAGAQEIDRFGVAESGLPYAGGADARVGSSGANGTYGVTTNGDVWPQVAWHFSAKNTTRTFVVSYRMRRFVTAYDDVGDLYLQIWGDQWPVRLDELHARILFPGATRGSERRLVRVWGHPASVRGSTRIVGPAAVAIDASRVPPGTFVELETTFPRRLLPAPRAAVTAAGDGLPRIVAREQRIFASPYGQSSGPATAPGGGGGWLERWWWILALPAVAILGLLGLGRRSGSDESSGLGGSLGGGESGGRSGGGGGGGGGGAW